MNFDQPQRFPACMATLPELLSLVARVCEQAGFSYEARLRAELAIEELFTNSVQHGYANDSTQSVWLSSLSNSGHILIRYQDTAPAYNPLTDNTPCCPNLNALAGREGGFGINLLRGMATAVRYIHEDGRNTLELEFSDHRPQAADQ